MSSANVKSSSEGRRYFSELSPRIYPVLSSVPLVSLIGEYQVFSIQLSSVIFQSDVISW